MLDDIYENYGLLSIRQIIKNELCILMYRFANNLIKLDQSFIDENNIENPVSILQENERLFNNLSYSVVAQPTLFDFKGSLKKSILME